MLGNDSRMLNFCGDAGYMLAPIPHELSFEDAACLAVASLTAGGSRASGHSKRGTPSYGDPLVQLVECSSRFWRVSMWKSPHCQRLREWTPFASQGLSTISTDPLEMCGKRHEDIPAR